ncbi:hypothetical protein ACFS07_14205 [Undibacterium arcticum]
MAGAVERRAIDDMDRLDCGLDHFRPGIGSVVSGQLKQLILRKFAGLCQHSQIVEQRSNFRCFQRHRMQAAQ